MNLTQKDYDEFRRFLLSNFGINLTDEKKTLVIVRLTKEFDKYKTKSLKEYMDIVKSDLSGKMLETLINKITTNHTYFYRENAHFEFLRNEVIPYILKKKEKERDIRIWSAGCSVGAEAYTIAMVLHDSLGIKYMSWDTTILATDISTKVLKEAKEGLFSSKIIEELPLMWRLNYFDKISKEIFSVKNNIKNEVIFKRHNLIKKFPFKKKFDVIFCRNVMIYFNEETKVKLINKFYNLLDDGGYLIIGHSENIDKSKSKFVTIRPSIYRK